LACRESVEPTGAEAVQAEEEDHRSLGIGISWRINFGGTLRTTIAICLCSLLACGPSKSDIRKIEVRVIDGGQYMPGVPVLWADLAVMNNSRNPYQYIGGSGSLTDVRGRRVEFTWSSSGDFPKGEGKSKKFSMDSKGQLFMNVDPQMIQLKVEWIRQEGGEPIDL
jgi:hypothetical protein